jgi:ubiquinone/menaquinone biosynthesis C-methylase UbiE
MKLMSSKKYDPENYWDTVAQRITCREKDKMIAGDNEPYYSYKRNKFLRIFNSIHFEGKRVLEIGSGPGGNLLEVLQHNPAELYGTDLSAKMIALAEQTIADKKVTLIKINGKDLPFADHYFNIVYSATVLQHITNEEVLSGIVGNMCRVAAEDIYIFERIEKKMRVGGSNIGRTIDMYTRQFSNHRFFLEEVTFLNLHISYLLCGVIRKICNRKNRKEAEPVSRLSERMQRIILPVTKRLDNIFKRNRDMAMLHFIKKK